MNTLQMNLLVATSSELELAKSEIYTEQYQKIRGVTAFWNDLEETARITFYYNGEITEDDVEIASDICGYIAAHLTKGMIDDKYVRIDYPQKLPENNFWAYQGLYTN